MALYFDKTLEAMRGGERLMFTHADPTKESDRSFYSLIPSGKTVHPLAIKQLNSKGMLSPVADGLFGAETSQTFELRQS